MSNFNRRDFLRTSLIGSVAAACIKPLDVMASIGRSSQVNTPVPLLKAGQYLSSVALTTGDNRADMVFRALKPYSEQIARAIGNKRVILKPNNVSIDIPLCATHVDTLEGILEFLKSIKKDNNVIIAESAAGGPTLDGFKNYGYYSLLSKYPVKLVDLDQEPYELVYVFDEKDFRPHPVRMTKVLRDPDSYIVSVARMKTHDRIVATLSLKNIVFGSPIKDVGFSWSPSRKPGTVNDKPKAHGGGIRGINYNLFALSDIFHPDLSVIDGFEGMEGNGPNRGTPVDHRVCVVSTDWLSADRVAVELMGIDFVKIGYLNYCASAGKGVADLEKIEIKGEPVSKHIIKYRLSDNINDQLAWMNPA
jgi:uncharacterized protein (DUF362 family)